MLRASKETLPPSNGDSLEIVEKYGLCAKVSVQGLHNGLPLAQYVTSEAQKDGRTWLKLSFGGHFTYAKLS